jgi:hypothetical protein
MHLAHPMVQRALSVLTRRRFPGTGDGVSRWTARLGGVPFGDEALVLLHLEELAVNELRESFHHWVRTLAFPVRAGRLGLPLAHEAAMAQRGACGTTDEADRKRASDLLDDVVPELKRHLARHAASLTASLRDALGAAGVRARETEDARYRSRQGEVSTLIAENTLARLEREIERLQREQHQGTLFDEEGRLEQIARSIEEKQAEVRRRTEHYEEVRQQLEQERERVLRHLLPRRHALAGEAQVFPVAVEVRFPEGRP